MRAGWRTAFDVYVVGRNRALTLDEKQQMALQQSGLAGEAQTVPSAETGVAESASLRISVPETLEYYRNAGTWRNQLPDGGSHDGGTTRG